jgi:polyisoprenoid-binding protein YceI
MKPGLIAFALSSWLGVIGINQSLIEMTSSAAAQSQPFRQIAGRNNSTDGAMIKTAARTAMPEARVVDSYRINAAQSKFMARVASGGILWFMGHVHHIAMRDFTGEAQITSEAITPASLQLTIKSNSLEETGPKFTEEQKQTINKTMRGEVLETEKYPEITFKSTEITAEKTTASQYKTKIMGDLTLHGVTHRISIPALVSVDHGALHASGEFSVQRSDYKVKTHAIKGGTIRVRNKITFKFDIVADRT